MSLKIITDSACDLPEEIIEEYGITVLPFLIYIGEEEYVDGRTITAQAIYEAMRANAVPTTGQVPMEEFLQIFHECARQQKACLHLSFSSKMSGSYGTALIAAQEIRNIYPDFQSTIIDTQSGSLGQGLIVLEAAQMVRAGRSSKEIIARVKERSAGNVEHIFSVDDLNYLYRGGRVSYASAFLGGLLNVKPILHVQDGQIIPFQKVRGNKMVLKRIVELVKLRAANYPDQLIAISHADDLGKARQLQGLLQDVLGYKHFLVNVVGGVLGCHIGLGGVAAFFETGESAPLTRC